MRRPTIANKKSIGYFPSLSRQFSRDSSAHVHMFREDVYLGVMPIGGRSRIYPDFSVQIHGNEAATKCLISLLVSLIDYGYYDLPELLCEAVERIAADLTWHGCAVYEIVIENNNFQSISLSGFTLHGLLKVPGFYIQLVPVRDWRLLKKLFAIIPSSCVWKIAIPSILGGYKGYKKMITNLARFDRPGPGFLSADLEARQQTPGFNFMDYVRKKEIFDAYVTRSWGWDRRDSSLDYQTEFFLFYRRLTFAWAKAVLREHIIDEFNQLLQRLEIQAKIVITGLPAPEDILQAREDLISGKIQFEEASRFVLI